MAITGQLAVNCLWGDFWTGASENQWIERDLHVCFVVDKVKCSPNLIVGVHVLWKVCGTGGWLRHYNTTFFFFFFFLSTGVLALKRKWFCIILIFSVKFPYSLPLLSSVFILSAPLWFLISFVVQLLSFCILHLSWAVILESVMKWHQVTPPKIYRIMEKKKPLRSFSLSLPQHTFRRVWVSVHIHVHTCTVTDMHTHSCVDCTLHLTHTNARCMVFLKPENKEVHRICKRLCYHFMCSNVHKCSWHGRRAIEIAHPREGNRKCCV